MTARILVLGPGGYMGRLVVQNLVNRGHFPVLVGRDAATLRQVAGDHGHRLDIALVDATDRDGIANLLNKGDIVLNMTSPCSLTGIPVIESAMEQQCHYLDCSVEPEHLVRVFDDCDRWARASKVAVLPGIGWSSTPGQVLSRRLLKQDTDTAIRRVDIGSFITEGQYFFTPGAMKAELSAMFQPVPVFERKRHSQQDHGKRLRTFWLKNRRQEASSTGGVEQLTLPRIAPYLQEVNSFINRYGDWAPTIRTIANLATRLPRFFPGGDKLVSAAISRYLPPLGPEMRPARRATINSTVIATAYNAERILVAREECDISDPIAYTIDMLTFAVEQLLNRQQQASGVLAITECFDAETVDQAHRVTAMRLARAHRKIAPSSGPQILPGEDEIAELERMMQF